MAHLLPRRVCCPIWLSCPARKPSAGAKASFDFALGPGRTAPELDQGVGPGDVVRCVAGRVRQGEGVEVHSGSRGPPNVKAATRRGSVVLLAFACAAERGIAGDGVIAEAYCAVHHVQPTPEAPAAAVAGAPLCRIA